MTPCYNKAGDREMGKLEKLIEKILKLDKNLRFDELVRDALIEEGY